MSASGFLRGWLCQYDTKEQKWFYVETGEYVDDVPDKPCKRCGELSTGEDGDYCLRELLDCDFVSAACCGHGGESGFILLADGRLFREECNLCEDPEEVYESLNIGGRIQ